MHEAAWTRDRHPGAPHVLITKLEIWDSATMRRKCTWGDVRLAAKGKAASMLGASFWGRGESDRVVFSN